jgi:hypothetical protein
MAISKGYACRVYKGAATHTDFTTEAMTDSGDGLTFYIADPAKRFWDSTHTTVVYVNATPTAATIQYAGGRVTFASSQAGATVTASGGYFAMDKTYMVESFEISVEPVLDEYTYLGCTAPMVAWIMNGASATINGLHEDNTFFDRADDMIAVSIMEYGTADTTHVDAGGCWEFYGRVGDKVAIEPTKLIRDSVTLTVTEGVYYRVYV